MKNSLQIHFLQTALQVLYGFFNADNIGLSTRELSNAKYCQVQQILRHYYDPVPTLIKMYLSIGESMRLKEAMNTGINKNKNEISYRNKKDELNILTAHEEVKENDGYILKLLKAKNDSTATEFVKDQLRINAEMQKLRSIANSRFK
jgi:uncharacterized protein YneR